MFLIPLTLIISLCLVFTFVVFFILEQRSRHIHSAVPARVSTSVHAYGAPGHVCVNNGACDSCRLRAEHSRLKAALKPASSSTTVSAA